MAPIHFQVVYTRKQVSPQKDLSVRLGLDNVTANRCQYCGFPGARTLDHFLEKVQVPELSLFAPNLIPCCWICNHDRPPAFETDGTRQLLHFYDDDVDSIPEVLIANVKVPGHGVPVADYSVGPSTHPLVDVYRRHFTNWTSRHAIGMKHRTSSRLSRRISRNSCPSGACGRLPCY